MMPSPQIAFVLGAGFGERLRPMTLATPKPLMPIWNRPLLAHTLALLERWGVREVYINTHWLPERIREFIAAYQGGLILHELHEPEILGTGGCLRALKPHLKGEPFWLVNGDIVFDCAPEPIMAAFEASGYFAAAWMESKKGPRTVESDYAGRVTCWASPTPGVEHTYTFTGVSLLSPEVIDFLPAEKPMCSVVEAFNAAMYAGRFVRVAEQPSAYWNDAGTLATYLQVHRDVKKSPALAAYAVDADKAPAPEVKKVLAQLKWKLDETIVIPLGTRGSQRTFWRLVGPRRSVIAIAYETTGRAENARYAACAHALAKAGVPVPRVLVDKPKLLVLEDFGDDTLDHYAAHIRETLEPITHHECACGHDHKEGHECHCHEDGHECHCHEGGHECHCHDEKVAGNQLTDNSQLTTENCRLVCHSPMLGQVMEMLAAFHAVDTGDLTLEPAFDQKLYDWEVGLYEQFVAPFSAEAKEEWKRLQAVLLAEPQVLVHRDFQSSNILWCNQRPGVIDFQGMRRGAALYDIASFLADPYTDWGPYATADALKAYAKASGRDEVDLAAGLPCAVVQRLTQAIGAFHRLASVGQPRFLTYVPLARTRAVAAAEAAGYPAIAKCLLGND
jgi:aminoglycoside/choline kinase family phosphotransferase/dTDP-glucose pyrophosphorylase